MVLDQDALVARDRCEHCVDDSGAQLLVHGNGGQERASLRSVTRSPAVGGERSAEAGRPFRARWRSPCAVAQARRRRPLIASQHGVSTIVSDLATTCWAEFQEWDLNRQTAPRESLAMLTDPNPTPR